MMTNHIGEARIKVPDRITRGEVIVVNSIISHPMDTGFFRNVDGDPIPAYFIKEVVVTYGEQEVARFEWTSGISRDPVVSFTVKADKEAPHGLDRQQRSCVQAVRRHQLRVGLIRPCGSLACRGASSPGPCFSPAPSFMP